MPLSSRCIVRALISCMWLGCCVREIAVGPTRRCLSCVALSPGQGSSRALVSIRTRRAQRRAGARCNRVVDGLSKLKRRRMCERDASEVGQSRGCRRRRGRRRSLMTPGISGSVSGDEVVGPRSGRSAVVRGPRFGVCCRVVSVTASLPLKIVGAVNGVGGSRRGLMLRGYHQDQEPLFNDFDQDNDFNKYK